MSVALWSEKARKSTGVRLGRRIGIIGVVLASIVAGVPGIARASTTGPVCAGAYCTQTFTAQGDAPQSFTVPSGVTSLSVTVAGAEGGNLYGSTDAPGGETAAVLPVSPSEALTLVVGDTGSGNGSAGYGGGGSGLPSNGGGSGGGGGSFLSGSGSLLLAAGGGGGNGDDNAGGGGAGANQSAASGTSYPGYSGSGGGGATGTQAGAAGCLNSPCGMSGGGPANLTSPGAGGNGSSATAGGGGGGGYYGGGGGAYAGGGGGSGYAGSSATSVTGTVGANSGAGFIIIVYPNLTVISVSPGSKSFGGVTEGQTSSTQSFQISNTGVGNMNVGAVTLGGADPGQFAITSDGCSGTSLAGGASCVVVADFAPTTAGHGAQSAVLDVPSNASNGNTTVALTGTGLTAAANSVSPGSEAFGGVTQNAASAPVTFTVTDTGDSSMTVGQVGLTGANSSQFEIANDTCSGQTVTGGGSCSVQVEFTPIARGAQAATLVVPSNAPNGSASATLSGTGLAPAVVSATPVSEIFGSVTLGQDSATRQVVVTNAGDRSLNVSTVTLTGANPGQFAILTDGCSATSLGGGQTCSETVRFDPTNQGAQSAELTIASNDQNSPTEIPLTGTGATAPHLSSVDHVASGQVVIGQSTTQTLTISDTGDDTLAIASATLGGANTGDFTLTPDDCSGQSLTGDGGSCTIGVNFTPSTRGPETASITIASNAPSSPTTITLTGQGINAAEVSASPISLEFGSVTTGQSSSQTMTLTNGGDEPLQIANLTLGGTGQAAYTLRADGCSGQTIAPQGTCTVTVGFSPLATGSDPATLTVASNAFNGLLSITLDGTGAPPQSTPPTTGTGTSSNLPVISGPTSATPVIARQGPGGQTTFPVTVSSPGTVTVAIQRDENGKLVTVATETIPVTAAGTIQVPVAARAHGTPLAPGAYQVSVTETSSAGTSAPATVPLTIKPPANGPHGRPRLVSAVLTHTTITWPGAHREPFTSLRLLASRGATLHLQLTTLINDRRVLLATTTLRAQVGFNQLQLVGHWHGLLFPARHVAVNLYATAAGHRSPTTRLQLTVKHRG